ncbi:MAG: cupredoxin family protein [Aromatoleum sp.]|jgi:uncharacterized cupredoxin-like copper-binding protein|uniref:cupredoxin domain-containing protein n=1 Tax=Aromatoleum sp. TaxID=2307007 RepID=UPI002895F8EE|nr:cupredoxin family protein [Aromatoleum sp.]MDT3668886.1 cupredoxin family protein [Aromatoleum sp.]
MNSRRRFLSGLLLSAGSLLSGAVRAHNGEKHPGPKAATVERIQQPWGIAGDPAQATRTIPITMSDDMRFTPDRIDVRVGETVRFVYRNVGKVLHEMVLGTKATLDEHADLMKKFPGMEHDEPWMAHVAPGGRGEIVWTFNRPGEFDFACLIPGHYDAGMVGRIVVAES